MASRGRYGLAVLIALAGLVPNTLLTTAYSAMQPALGHDLGASLVATQVIEGLSNAGIAAGAVLGSFWAQRYIQRRSFLWYQGSFVLASLLAAGAQDTVLFGIGRVLQGVVTGLMVVNALPLLITRFGVRPLPVSVAVVDIGLFGAAAGGPLLGGLLSSSWRSAFLLAAALGLVGLIAAAVGYPRFDPPDPELRTDWPALVLATLGCALPFLAVALLTGHPLHSPMVVVTLTLGLVALVALVVVEWRSRDPLMPVGALSTQLPVTGILVAMVGGAVFVAVVGLVQLDLSKVAHLSPQDAGLRTWPMPLGLLVAATMFGTMFRTRWLPLLVDAGLAALLVGTVLLVFLLPKAGAPGAELAWATLLLGFGAGASVSPGLFLAGMGVPSRLLGRAFALVMLLRAEAAYIVGPVVLYAAQGSKPLSTGIRHGLIAMTGLSVVGVAAALVIPALSGARLRRPDLTAWLEDGEQALPSPLTAVHVRPGRTDDAAADLIPPSLRHKD